MKSAAEGEPADVEVRPEPPTAVRGIPADTTCTNHYNFPGISQVVFCNQPLRGGVTIWDSYSSHVCSLEFIVTNGPEEFVMTAGHCLSGGTDAWFSAFANYSPSNTETWGLIGSHAYRYIGELGDFATIHLLSGQVHSPWFPDNNLSSVADLHPGGGGGEDHLENITWSAVGDINCRTGGESDTQCGTVLSTANTVYFTGEGDVGYLTEDTFCAIPGDSGGTVFGNHSGMGMTEGISAQCGQAGAKTWYTEAIRDAVYSGVSFYVPW